MFKTTCPSCGAEITFQSSITVSCVCPACRSLVRRRGVNVEKIGEMAELPPDMSPFRIGTEGVYKGVHFSLIGRLKIGWTDGNWNEWFMLNDKGTKGWLAEAQGSLAISFERDEPGLPKTQPRLHQLLTLSGKQFSVTDIKQAECIGSEGELPFAAPRGRKTTSVDLMTSAGDFAGIEYTGFNERNELEPPRFFAGEYVEFDHLKFTNLRELPGWTARDLAHKAAK